MRSRGKGGYSDQEIYRLKKIVQKLKQELYNDEDSEAMQDSLSSERMSDFTISTLNLNGARDVRKRASLFELVKLKSINVMLVEEMQSDTLHETDWRREWDGEVVLRHLSRTSGGVALLFSKNIPPKYHVVEEVMQGRLMVVREKY